MSKRRKNAFSSRPNNESRDSVQRGWWATASGAMAHRGICSILRHPRTGANAYLSWVPLGSVSEFPEGETRPGHVHQSLRDPDRRQKPWKQLAGCGASKGEQFQVFAINCAHLGCPGALVFRNPVLFMCPCHGGAYYRDGFACFGSAGNAGCSSIRTK